MNRKYFWAVKPKSAEWALCYGGFAYESIWKSKRLAKEHRDCYDFSDAENFKIVKIYLREIKK